MKLLLYKQITRVALNIWKLLTEYCKLTDTFFTVLIYTRQELTHLILRLLQAWKELLSHFNQHIEHHQKLPDDSLSKAKQISNMIHELKTGVEKVTEKARFELALIYISHVVWVTLGWGNICFHVHYSLMPTKDVI